MNIDLEPLKFSFPCGNKRCEYPKYFCDIDPDYSSRSQCLSCSADVCSTYGKENFPRECGLFCNQKEVLTAVLSWNSTEGGHGNPSSQLECWSPLYVSMGLNILCICLITICTVCLVYRRRNKSLEPDAILPFCLWKKGPKGNDNGETSVMLPAIDPSMQKIANNESVEQQGCTSVQESSTVCEQASDEHGPNLRQVIPTDSNNSPKLNPVVTTSDRGFRRSHMTETKGVQGSYD